MQERKKALIVATIAGFIAAFEIDDIHRLQELGYEVHVATDFDAITKSNKSDILDAQNIIRHDIKFSRNPFDKRNLDAYRELYGIINSYSYELIHCHTPVGGVLTRLACKRIKKNRRPYIIYTVHGFHFYKGAPLKTWILYFPVEWVLSWWTDVIVTINKEDFAFAKSRMHSKHIEYLPGVGIDLTRFTNKGFDSTAIRKKLNIAEGDILLLSVGELSHRKNHEQVIRALSAIQNDKLRYFIVGEGVLKEQLKSLIESLSLANNISLLGYRTDIPELCSACDMFLLPSLQEGLPVALMEAIACKVPVVCSRIRGNEDLVSDESYMYDLKDTDELVRLITRLTKDGRNALINNTIEVVDNNYKLLTAYSRDNVATIMKKIYQGASPKR